MPDTQHWLFSHDDRVATLTLNRAGVMNSLTPDVLFELRDIARRLADDPDVWAVVVAGAGDHFSVGFDVSVINTMVGQDEGAYREAIGELQDCLDTFEALSKPTIARLSGFCLGGGLLLALCCDFRIASQRALFGLPEIKRGVVVVLGTQRVTRVAGVAATKEMILLADNFKSDAAQAYGLLHRVVPPDELDAAVGALADKFRHLPPRTVGAAKRIIDEGSALSLRDSQALERDLQATLLNSPDLKEGIESFLEKRAPNFGGR